MGKFKILPVVLAAFCTVLISFFVFSFIDSNASGGTNPVNEQENNSEENNSEENNSEGNTNRKDSTGNSDISNNVQNNVNGNTADISNDVENNVTGENADVSNTIDNNLENSNDNKIENNVTNNLEVNVNVNLSNNISNNTDAPESSSGEGNNEGNNNGKNENNGDNNNGDKEEEANNEEEDSIIWGVDSASLTTEEMLACVGDNFGSPDIWGRYLGDKDGVSKGLTSDEIELLHSNDIKILLIWNHFEDAKGYENGQNQAQAAIQMAQDLGVPEGVAIFADIEPDYPVDSEFIRGWFETMNESAYPPGVYGVFDAEQELYAALEQAGQDNDELLANTYIWTAAPNIGITTEANAPEYQPEAPDNALIGGWQYGLDAQECNIDTNLFHSDLLDVVW
ncbi:MAG: glycoside hydrolase domain-containing protein [Bacillota bacterium]